MEYRIFVVEDDERIAASMAAFLERYGYQATVASDLERVEQECMALQPHLIILDINLPYQNGFHLCRALRRRTSVPVLFLTARSGEMEQVMGLESGGDDYMTKPFHLEVLLARVRALLRRAHGEYAHTGTDVVTAGRLSLDLAAGEMRLGRQSQPLTRTELRLLHLLMTRAGQVVSREQCLEALWDDVAFVDDNTLTVNVTRLRTKLDAWGLREVVETRRGSGYRLAPDLLEGEP